MAGRGVIARWLLCGCCLAGGWLLPARCLTHVFVWCGCCLVVVRLVFVAWPLVKAQILKHTHGTKHKTHTHKTPTHAQTHYRNQNTHETMPTQKNTHKRKHTQRNKRTKLNKRKTYQTLTKPHMHVQSKSMHKTNNPDR